MSCLLNADREAPVEVRPMAPTPDADQKPNADLRVTDQEPDGDLKAVDGELDADHKAAELNADLKAVDRELDADLKAVDGELDADLKVADRELDADRRAVLVVAREWDPEHLVATAAPEPGVRKRDRPALVEAQELAVIAGHRKIVAGMRVVAQKNAVAIRAEDEARKEDPRRSGAVASVMADHPSVPRLAAAPRLAADRSLVDGLSLADALNPEDGPHSARAGQASVDNRRSEVDLPDPQCNRDCLK